MVIAAVAPVGIVLYIYLSRNVAHIEMVWPKTYMHAVHYIKIHIHNHKLKMHTSVTKGHTTHKHAHTLSIGLLSVSLAPSLLSVCSLPLVLSVSACLCPSLCLSASLFHWQYLSCPPMQELVVCLHIHVIRNCFLNCSWYAIVWAPRLILANPGRAILTLGLELLLVVVACLSDCRLWTNF